MKQVANDSKSGKLSTLLVSAVFAGFSMTASADFTARDLSVEQRPIAQLPASPQTNLSVTAWVDQRDETYRVGENLYLNVRASQDAYITVLDVGTSGKVHIIFPNDYQQDNRVRAGQTVRIPGKQASFDLRVGGPAGHELIKVIATTGPKPLFNPYDLIEAAPFREYNKDAMGASKDLSVVLREQHSQGWAQYDKVIRVSY